MLPIPAPSITSFSAEIKKQIQAFTSSHLEFEGEPTFLVFWSSSPFALYIRGLSPFLKNMK
jgi:hypothetical protein